MALLEHKLSNADRRNLDCSSFPIVHYYSGFQPRSTPILEPTIIIPKHGTLPNATTNGEQSARAVYGWKQQIAFEVRKRMAGRAPMAHPDMSQLAILSISLLFQTGRKRDIDNFTKPIIDAISIGLWSDMIVRAPYEKGARFFNGHDHLFFSLFLEKKVIETGREAICCSVFYDKVSKAH